MTKILLITGPGGSGKTTISKLLTNQRNYVYLDGDNEDTEFFPNGNQWLPENIEQLKKAHDKILKKTIRLVNEGKSVVIDYIIFGRYLEFIESFKKQFGNEFQVKVLFPAQNELVKRDTDRECWTTGSDRISTVFHEFNSIRDDIGRDNFIDTTDQTPEETLEKLLDINS